jgi:hypothetical protein
VVTEGISTRVYVRIEAGRVEIFTGHPSILTARAASGTQSEQSGTEASASLIIFQGAAQSEDTLRLGELPVADFAASPTLEQLNDSRLGLKSLYSYRAKSDSCGSLLAGHC